MLLMTLRAPNMPKRNLVSVRPHLNFMTAMARLLGDEPSRIRRRNGSLRIRSIGSRGLRANRFSNGWAFE
jgi:hypothetical protein